MNPLLTGLLPITTAKLKVMSLTSKYFEVLELMNPSAMTPCQIPPLFTMFCGTSMHSYPIQYDSKVSASLIA